MAADLKVDGKIDGTSEPLLLDSVDSGAKTKTLSLSSRCFKLRSSLPPPLVLTVSLDGFCNDLLVHEVIAMASSRFALTAFSIFMGLSLVYVPGCTALTVREGSSAAEAAEGDSAMEQQQVSHLSSHLLIAYDFWTPFTSPSAP